jgi:hypothetical protein
MMSNPQQFIDQIKSEITKSILTVKIPKTNTTSNNQTKQLPPTPLQNHRLFADEPFISSSDEDECEPKPTRITKKIITETTKEKVF